MFVLLFGKSLDRACAVIRQDNLDRVCAVIRQDSLDRVCAVIRKESLDRSCAVIRQESLDRVCAGIRTKGEFRHSVDHSFALIRPWGVSTCIFEIKVATIFELGR